MKKPLPSPENAKKSTRSGEGMVEGLSVTLGGGTDYFVRNPELETDTKLSFLGRNENMRGIARKDDSVEIGSGVTIREFFVSPIIREAIPGIERFESSMASLPIRNRATVAGNIANASPIADMSIILLALDASLTLASHRGLRSIPLSEFFLDYKKTALSEGESIKAIRIPRSSKSLWFNFEKVSKRARLDIASVNTAMAIVTDGDAIERCFLSAGGMAPVPLRLKKAESHCTGKAISIDIARETARLAVSETRPIDDIRGSAEYRRRLLYRLVFAHFSSFANEKGFGEAWYEVES